MFFDGSRYLKVKDYTVKDRSGRPVRVKRARPPLRVTGTFVYQVKAGDRLDLLAHKFYRNPRKWWLIGDANPGLLSPGEALRPGQLLVIPRDQAV
ncbi:MAG: LysM peptidoglycan-binding domain-containing protein [Candidatus Rokuibacteriota bacterium]